MRTKILIFGLAAACAATAVAQTMSPEAERLMSAARAQGMQITPEQAERLAERQRQMAGQLGALGLMAAAPSAAPAQSAATAELSEAQLGAEVRKAKPGTVSLDGTTDMRLVVGGHPYMDPEGELANVAADAERNGATFLLGRGASRPVKFVALTDMSSPVPVGRLSQRGGGFVFEGRTGVRISGDKFITLPDGIALWRDDAMFLYRFGTPVASHALPEGYYPADYQHGDVGRTGVMLLRRDQRSESANAGALRAAKSLFSMVGVGRKAASDFSLFDTRSGKLTPLAIENFGQDGEPLLDQVGQPSKSHYFWRVQWMQVGTRRLVVHRAKSMQQLLVTDLDSGRTAVAFDRGLGITSWAFKPDGRGSGRLVANWMMQDHAIDDLSAWFDGAPEIKNG
ncbi:hypothetical protein [Sphingomonas sp. BK580]|uniref:hypothetical protein n=1 Tax=Sphingomonas sp. BK580 TaxID=2586972 RepID=UPI001607D44A|nr:hypothetical protein [Sphingomonas sp. BK580]MBB3693530.1 hypothetical protein [Sphingomonas sp. BK580]